jgi:diadenosine tetraphosphate (Ap4A) HIT family hydrolase
VERKLTHVWFTDVEEQQCDAWIDYCKDDYGKFLWYAVLAGDQYTLGHTLVILGSHRRRITDCSLTESELGALSRGLKKVACRLKDVLGAKAIHVLSLCEGEEHLHFHLIPRYSYTDEEKLFFSCKYSEREKGNPDFADDVKTGKIHGMWYAAYHEMKFKTSEFWKHSVEARVMELQELAECLRDRNLKDPF